MASWTKKLNEVSQADLQPGEELITAVFLQPSGTIGKAVGSGVGGILGKAVRPLGLTVQRLLIYSYGSMSGKPTELEMSIPTNDLVSIETEKQQATHKFIIRFSDGTATAFEAPRVNNDHEGFAATVNSR